MIFSLFLSFLMKPPPPSTITLGRGLVLRSVPPKSLRSAVLWRIFNSNSMTKTEYSMRLERIQFVEFQSGNVGYSARRGRTTASRYGHETWSTRLYQSANAGRQCGRLSSGGKCILAPMMVSDEELIFSPTFPRCFCWAEHALCALLVQAALPSSRSIFFTPKIIVSSARAINGRPTAKAVYTRLISRRPSPDINLLSERY